MVEAAACAKPATDAISPTMASSHHHTLPQRTGPTGAGFVAKALALQTNLTTLNLSYNEIEPQVPVATASRFSEMWQRQLLLFVAIAEEGSSQSTLLSCKSRAHKHEFHTNAHTRTNSTLLSPGDKQGAKRIAASLTKLPQLNSLNLRY